jgi:hypothetical protein
LHWFRSGFASVSQLIPFPFNLLRLFSLFLSFVLNYFTPAPILCLVNTTTTTLPSDLATRLEKSAEKAFAKFPKGKSLIRAEALARRARDARRLSQDLFASENPRTVYPFAKA